VIGHGHGHLNRLVVDGDSLLHRLPAECKLAAAALFVFAVVATPRESLWAFGCFAVLVIVVANIALVPLRTLLRRLSIEVPFIAFAVFLPIVGQGERVDVVGVSLSTSGLWAAWNIVAKGTLGVCASVILAATTPVPDMLQGLQRLRVPRAFTLIAGFMVRYLDVVTDELRRMRIARESRGHDPRWIWQARAVASSAGALFIRSYERGERVYLAMLSRGFQGSLPAWREPAASGRQWAVALTAPVSASMVAAAAWWVRS
jgi:cobalt/nickel transport system permease protein